MLTLKDNIRAVLDSNFAETKDEIKEVALNVILELIENDRKDENSSEKPNNSTISKMEQVETMSCQECKWWFTDSLKHGGYCQSLLYNHECRYEPQTDCSWK